MKGSDILRRKIERFILFNYTIMETFIVVLLILWCAIVIPAMVIETIIWVYDMYKDLFK